MTSEAQDWVRRTAVARRLAVAAAGLLGVPAGLYLPTAGLAAAVAVTAAATVFFRRGAEASGCHGPGERGTLVLCLLAALTVGAMAGPQLGRFLFHGELRTWNVFHYYLGAKYFDELGYDGLYAASLAADEGGQGAWRRVRKVRDLGSYRVVDRSDLEPVPEGGFTAERWHSFEEDVAHFPGQLPTRTWRQVFRDRGYNATPFWTTLAAPLLSALPRSPATTTRILPFLDLALFLITGFFVLRAFGPRTLAWVVLIFFLLPVNQGRFVGGFLQYDWLCAFLIALCLLRLGKPGSAGALAAYAVLARIFPLVFVLSGALPVAWRWWRERRRPRRELRFLAAFCLWCVAGIALSGLGPRGWSAWGEFRANIEQHNYHHVVGTQRVGLQHLFTHPFADRSFEASKEERRQALTEQRPLLLGFAVVLLAGYAATVFRRRPSDARTLGLIPLFVLTVSSRYYASFLTLLALPAAAEAGAGRQRDRLAATFLGVIAGAWLLTLIRPERYAVYIVFNLLLTLFYGWLLLQKPAGRTAAGRQVSRPSLQESPKDPLRSGLKAG